MGAARPRLQIEGTLRLRTGEVLRLFPVKLRFRKSGRNNWSMHNQGLRLIFSEKSKCSRMAIFCSWALLVGQKNFPERHHLKNTRTMMAGLTTCATVQLAQRCLLLMDTRKMRSPPG